MNKETERKLNEIIEHRTKAMDLIIQSSKLREEVNNYSTIAEKTAALEKIARLNLDADAENEKADNLHNELLADESKKNE